MPTDQGKPSSINYPPATQLMLLVVVAAGYFGAARLGLLLASVHGNVSPVWPATGVAMGALLLGGSGLWPGIAAGAFLANALTAVSLPVAGMIAAGNTLEALAGAWIVQRCTAVLRDGEFDHLAEPAGIVLATALAPVISATCGVLALFVGDGGAMPRSLTGTLWWTWWVGDALGALIVAPLFLAFRDLAGAERASLLRGGIRQGARVLVLLGVSIGAGWVVFFQPGSHGLLFAIFPVLLLAGLWFGSIGTKVTAFLISALGLGAAFQGTGPFAGNSLNEDLMYLQLFLMSVGLSALILPAFRATGRVVQVSLLLLAGWSLSGWLFFSLHQDRLRADAAHLERLATDATGRIRQRLESYEDSLRGSAGLLAARGSVGQAEWRAYVASLKLSERYPGLQGFGVVLPVPADDVAAFVARMRHEGAADFAIRPAPDAETGTEPAERFVLSYIEPREPNQRALGVDAATETHRRQAAEAARDTGTPQLTRRITLAQDPEQRAGFVLFMPVYRPGAPTATVEQRRAALVGWVDAVFPAGPFLESVLERESRELALHFFEGTAPGAGSLLHHSPGTRTDTANFEHFTQLHFGGQDFTLGWNRNPGFVSSGPSSAVWAATSAALVSLLLVGLVVGLDSARHRMRQLANERTDALNASEQRFRVLIENVRDYGIFILDPAGRVTTWNPGAIRNTGYAADEVIGRHFSIFYNQSDISLDKPGRELAAARNQGHVEDEGWRVRKDGTAFWAQVAVTALRDQTGEVVGFLKIVRDVTERKRLEESLAQARDEALQASQLKSEFLATMSHEIRTPMNSIIGMSGLLLDSDPTSEQRLMARVIQNSAESLLAILDDILDFSKIEAGKLRLDPVDFDLRHVVEETLALHAPRAHQKRLELMCTCDATLSTPLHGDAGRIRQVLSNLVNNAIKFTETGEVSVTVDLIGEQAGHRTFRITVRDTGIGLTPEARARLFEPFTQGDGSASRRFGGTGLGLAICRQLVELMHGRIGYDSAPGQGSTFWFELELPFGSSAEPVEVLASFPPGVRILIVDDNATNRWILLEQLAHFGLEVKAVGDGTAALAWLWAQAAVRELPHLVLLDHQMPGMSGLQLAQEIRGDATLRHLPLVMLSSTGPIEDPVAASAVGFAACLVKPVRGAQLHRTLARVLSGLNLPKPRTTPPMAKIKPADGLKLLFAEDNKDNQTVLRMIFEKLGHTVIMVNNGSEALDRLARETFDAVIMDCQMPVMDGYETSRLIRAGQVPGINPRIPIIALTAHVMPGERQKCLSAGMDDYLTKPVRMSAVQAAFLRCGLLKGAPKQTKT